MQTYFILATITKCVKIGRSKDPEERLKTLQTASPEILRLVGTMDGDFEAELHEKFAAYRVRGEWFILCGELTCYMMDNVPNCVLGQTAFEASCVDVKLQEKRAQIEETVQHHNELVHIDEEAVQKTAEIWGETFGWELDECGKDVMREAIEKFGLDETLEAIRIASRQYIRRDDKGLVTMESSDYALNKISGICYVRTQEDPEKSRAIHAARSILKSKYHYYKDENFVYMMEYALKSGRLKPDELIEAARNCRVAQDFRDACLGN
jgi:hypothetical protein